MSSQDDAKKGAWTTEVRFPPSLRSFWFASNIEPIRAAFDDQSYPKRTTVF